MARRELLGVLALGTLAALTGCGTDDRRITFPKPVPGPAASYARSKEPTRRIALTIDDGYDPETLAAYVQLAHDSGLPITFDPIGKLAPTWEAHADKLKPLIEKGQVQIANHTFNHLSLPTLSDARIKREIEQNEEWIEKTFGITARPYLRPPSGLHDSRVDAIAGDLGFTRILMWQGSFGDASTTTAAQLLAMAEQSLLPGAIVVGHANVGTVTSLYPQIMEIIASRNLVPSTIDEVFGTSRSLGA
jgi:peptidoglycan/xylan/chitin deacetylase (PgdA/CDA1 family)